MPDSSGEKTEKPTPRRLQKAREEGQVARSKELSSAFTLLASFVVLYFLFGNIIHSLSGKMTFFLSLDSLPQITKDGTVTLMTDLFVYVVKLVGPIMMASMIIGLLISFIQVGPLFTTKVIQPKLNKLNPVEGAKRLFSLRSVIELIKSLAKAVVIIFLTYLQLRNNWHHLITMIQQGHEVALLFLGKLIFRIGINIIIFLVILGIADYIYQRWDFMKNMRMTKQEVKEEYKEYEGDPQIKSKRRERQRQMSMNRMIAAVEEADVVITNPTHIAVALQFDIETMEAPVVVAKGEGFIARKIKEEARKHEIEIVENKPLARALNETTEVGDEIPADLYQAVAEILAFVYKNNGKY